MMDTEDALILVTSAGYGPGVPGFAECRAFTCERGAETLAWLLGLPYSHTWHRPEDVQRDLQAEGCASPDSLDDLLWLLAQAPDIVRVTLQPALAPIVQSLARRAGPEGLSVLYGPDGQPLPLDPGRLRKEF